MKNKMKNTNTNIAEKIVLRLIESISINPIIHHLSKAI